MEMQPDETSSPFQGLKEEEEKRGEHVSRLFIGIYDNNVRNEEIFSIELQRIDNNKLT